MRKILFLLLVLPALALAGDIGIDAPFDTSKVDTGQVIVTPIVDDRFEIGLHTLQAYFDSLDARQEMTHYSTSPEDVLSPLFQIFFFMFGFMLGMKITGQI